MNDIRFFQPSMSSTIGFMRKASKKRIPASMVSSLRRSQAKSRIEALRRPDGKMVRDIGEVLDGWAERLPAELGIPSRLLFGSADSDY